MGRALARAARYPSNLIGAWRITVTSMKNTSPASYYRATANAYPAYAPLKARSEAKVAIIGGGFAGLHAALGLAERGMRDVVLLEREQIGFGASGRNGGFVFAGYSLGEQALLDAHGGEQARAMFQRTTDAVDQIGRAHV